MSQQDTENVISSPCVEAQRAGAYNMTPSTADILVPSNPITIHALLYTIRPTHTIYGS